MFLKLYKSSRQVYTRSANKIKTRKYKFKLFYAIPPSYSLGMKMF